MLMTIAVHLLFGGFLLGMALIFWLQYLLTFGQTTWIHRYTRKVIGGQGYKVLMSLYPASLMPLTRIFSFMAGFLISIVLLYYILSVMAVYFGFNPLGITPAIISSTQK